VGQSSTTRAEPLRVPGASLYYEVRGSGPILLMMPGGPATGSVFDGVAGHLAQHYTVITYDPRGLSRSKLEGSIDDERIVEIFADDAHRLLKAVAGDQAFVFSSSGAAIIGLELAARYPDRIRTLVAHEPPRFGPPAQDRTEGEEDLHATYRARGVWAAMVRFMTEAGLGEPSPEMLDSMEANRDLHFFLGHYIVGLARHMTDIRAIKSAACRIVPAVGADSRGEPAHLGGLGLAEILGTEAAVFPGGHGGFMTHPAEFANRLREVL
jgi:pimeloyl-ACP methyl ester carboxylesterase